jgi:hypothetical protein
MNPSPFNLQTKEGRQLWRAAKNARQRRWRTANPDRVKIYNRTDWQRNMAKRKARQRAYYWRDPERGRARVAAYRGGLARPPYLRPEIPYERTTEIPMLIGMRMMLSLDTLDYFGRSFHELISTDGLSPLQLLIAKEETA